MVLQLLLSRAGLPLHLDHLVAQRRRLCQSEAKETKPELYLRIWSHLNSHRRGWLLYTLQDGCLLIKRLHHPHEHARKRRLLVNGTDHFAEHKARLREVAVNPADRRALKLACRDSLLSRMDRGNCCSVCRDSAMHRRAQPRQIQHLRSSLSYTASDFLVSGLLDADFLSSPGQEDLRKGSHDNQERIAEGK